MLQGNEENFYERIRVSADRINRRSLWRTGGGSGEGQEAPPRRGQEVPRVSRSDAEDSGFKVTPEVLVVSRALRDHGIAHIEGMPSDEYDCCAHVAIQAYDEYKRSIRRGGPDTVYNSLLNG